MVQIRLRTAANVRRRELRNDSYESQTFSHASPYPWAKSRQLYLSTDNV